MNEIEQKEIEEMAIIDCQRVPKGLDCSDCQFANVYNCNSYRMATALFNTGYRNVKDKVVLDKEKYEDLKEYKNIAEQRKFNLDYANIELKRLAVELNSAEEANECANKLLDKYREELKQTSQKTAREILQIIKREYDYIGNLERIIAKEYGVEVE